MGLFIEMLNDYILYIQVTTVHCGLNIAQDIILHVLNQIIKDIEQNQLTWYGHVQRMAEGRLPKIALKWMPKQKRA
jgi:hypothetical protein